MGQPSKESTSDRPFLPLRTIAGVMLMGVAPTLVLAYQLIRDNSVPRWTLVAAPACTLFFTFFAYLNLKAHYDEELRQKAYEVQQRHE